MTRILLPHALESPGENQMTPEQEHFHHLVESARMAVGRVDSDILKTSLRAVLENTIEAIESGADKAWHGAGYSLGLLHDQVHTLQPFDHRARAVIAFGAVLELSQIKAPPRSPA